MSKERELLQRILDTDPKFLGGRFIAEIQELLAQPEQDQEPAAWIIETEVEGKLLEWVCTDKKHYMEAHDSIKKPLPLYTAPPKREPLSDEAICEILLKKEWKGFVDLVRIIEKAHGIGGTDV